MAKKFGALLLCAVMIFSVFSLSSCSFLTNGIMEDLLSGSGNNGTNINVEGGDTHNVTIQGAETAEVLAVSKALLSSVSIICEFRGKMGSENYAYSGSGVIYKLDKEKGEAYIITNYHVVHDDQSNTLNKISSKIHVMLYGQEYADYMMDAEYVGGSAQYDIAVIKITANAHLMSSSATAASFANSNDVSVLEKVVAIGNPGGNGISATVGYVNVDSEEIDLDGMKDNGREFRVIRTDAAVNSGNSGGGLFNLEGNVVGIVNAKMANESVDNIGYAIPSNVAKAVADNIVYYCDGTTEECPKRVLMGITVTHTNLRTEYNTETGKVRRFETVIVEDVTKGGAVDGLIKKGDVINYIVIDGVKYEVTRIFHVVDCMLNARLTSAVTINVTRGDQTLDIEIPINSSMLTDWK